MKEIEKWRDTVDPLLIKFKKIKILEILGYPYANSDVFHMRAFYNNAIHYCYLKCKRNDSSHLDNEVEVLKKIDIDNIPVIVEYGDDYSYIVTEELLGDKLSDILRNDNRENSLLYMEKFGAILAKIHLIKGDYNEAIIRKYHSLPELNDLKQNGLEEVYTWLVEHKPTLINKCFVHGDLHYANVLWRDREVSGILDFELAGIGNKEFDIAWSLVVRPGQTFMKTSEELDLFLKGYSKYNTFNREYVRYYMMLIYTRFYNLGDEEYQSYVKGFIITTLNDYKGFGEQ